MKKSDSGADVGRRSFLKKVGGTTFAGLTVGTLGVPALGSTSEKESFVQKASLKDLGESRADNAFQLRVAAAQRQYDQTTTDHPTNGDESRYASFIGNFSKTLPHNGLGEVDTNAYEALLAAVASGQSSDYGLIPLGGTARLANPQAANAYQVESCDSHALAMRPPPPLASLHENAEIIEVYWQAVARDIAFDDYPGDPLIAAAVREFRRFPIFRGVTQGRIFRGETSGDHIGPYISQFLVKPIPYGSTTIDQRYRVPVAGDDKMTTYTEWLNIQNGISPSSPIIFDPTPRYIRNGRDLAEYVHTDTPAQPYHNAALIMLGWRRNALSATNPYHSIGNQAGFVQFGLAHVLDMVSRVSLAALKAAWFQKWNVHRRLRPEAFAGIIHNELTGQTKYGLPITSSRALDIAFGQSGTYLLPMAYPEGSPAHPAYPAGHATIAGACATVLKAFFREDFPVPAPVTVTNDGQSLGTYNGTLRLGHELNKLAANISLGRDFAGVHWRSDGIEGMKLGEKVAIQLLSDYTETYNEDFGGFTFTKFDGETVTV